MGLPLRTPFLRGSPIRRRADALPARAAFDADAPIGAAAGVQILEPGRVHVLRLGGRAVRHQGRFLCALFGRFLS